MCSLGLNPEFGTDLNGPLFLRIFLFVVSPTLSGYSAPSCPLLPCPATHFAQLLLSLGRGRGRNWRQKHWDLAYAFGTKVPLFREKDSPPCEFRIPARPRLPLQVCLVAGEGKNRETQQKCPGFSAMVCDLEEPPFLLLRPE